MTLPRPLLLALLGAVLVGGAFFATLVLGGGAEPSAEADPVSTTQAPGPRGPGTAPTRTPARKQAPPGLPPRIGRELGRDKVLVLLFTQTGAADDDATVQALEAIDSPSNRVAVFHDSIARIGLYKQVVSGVGVSQAPATVIVGRDRKARVLEGYVDAGSMRQAVRDADR